MKDMQQRIEIFERLPVRQAVIRQILPAIASQMIALIYNLADTYYVGKLNDPSQTAAITVATASFVMLTAVSNLLGVGGASLIAGHLGKKEADKAAQVSAVAFWGALAAAIAFSLLFTVLARPVLYLCGATDATYHQALAYARWVVIIGGPANVLNILLANLIRAEGSAATASFGVSLGGVVNIVLDPFFVLPRFLGLGAEGAGMATALSNAVAMTYLLVHVLRRRSGTVIDLHPRHLRHIRQHLRPILTIGFPSAVQYALTVVAVSAQMKFVSGYETEAVAALGIIKKLDQLPLYFSIGVANGLLPLGL